VGSFFSRHDSSLKFLFWGFVKDSAYQEKVQDMNESHASIIRAAECVTKDMLIPGKRISITLMCVVPLWCPY
jgi:hypothetical protein